MIQIVEPSVQLYKEHNPLKKIEFMARICTGTESSVKQEPNLKLIQALINRGHESVLEHYYIKVKFPFRSVTIPAEYLNPAMLKAFALADKSERTEEEQVELDRYKEEFQRLTIDNKKSDVKEYTEQETALNDQLFFQLYTIFNPKFTKPSVSSADELHTVNQHLSIQHLELIGNIRAMRDGIRILSEGNTFGMLRSGDPGFFSYCISLIKSLYTWQPILFEDLVQDFKTYWEAEDAVTLQSFGIEEWENYASFIIETDRNVSHQFVRHRNEISYSQQSQRYCKYKDGVRYTRPVGFSWAVDGNPIYEEWKTDMEANSAKYLKKLDDSLPPEEARLWLNSSCYTKLGVTMTPDALQHFMKLRDADDAYAPIRHIAKEIRKALTPAPIENDHPFINLNGEEIMKDFGEEIAKIVSGESN